MKYIKSISLFFVYPMCCFLIGFFTAYQMTPNTSSESVVEEEIFTSEEMMQESVISNRALQEFIPQNEEYQTVEEGYFITIHNGYVTVFSADRSSVYMATGIKAETLPEDVIKSIKTGLYVPDEGMLYDFLESYTS